MKHYQQLTIEDREAIQRGRWERLSLREIATRLERSPSTISRELKRNLPPTLQRYTPRLAQERADRTIRARGHRERLKHLFIRTYVLTKLRGDFSPEQIAGRLTFEHPAYTISPEAIYQFIYAQYYRGGYGDCHGLDLRGYLKRRHKQRRLKHLPWARATGPIAGRISIDERPTLVRERTTLGHWEGDSLVSRKSPAGLNSLVERVSGLLLLSKLENSTALETTSTVLKRLGVLSPNLRQTLTLDNGHENAGHQLMAERLRLSVYFAHPYCSCERGTNENTNGLIRYYVPKGTDIALVSEERVAWIEHRLNTRPRKRLGFRTPLEVFNQRVALKR